MLITQPSFTGGEVSPSVQSRVDISKYAVSAKTMKNFFCHAHGGVSNRPGTLMVEEVKDSSKKGRLIPFIYSNTQAYALLFGDYSLRFIAEVSGTHGYLTQNLVASGTFKWSASGSGTSEYYLELAAGGTPGIMEVLNLFENSVEISEGTLGSLSAGEWGWGDNDTLGYSTLYVRLTDSVDPDTKADGYLYHILELTTPYSESDISSLDVKSTKGEIYIAHPNYYPRLVTYTSSVDWSIEEVPIIDGPYRSVTPDDFGISMKVTGRTGIVFIQASEVVFNSKHIGSPLRLGFTSPNDATDIQWGYGIIQGIAQSLKVNDKYIWASSAGTGKYLTQRQSGGGYGDPGLTEPTTVYEDGVEMTQGVLGSLSSGEWAWGDDDSLGYNTVYAIGFNSATPGDAVYSGGDGCVFSVIDSSTGDGVCVEVNDEYPYLYEHVTNPKFIYGTLGWNFVDAIITTGYDKLDVNIMDGMLAFHGYKSSLAFAVIEVYEQATYQLTINVAEYFQGNAAASGSLRVYVGYTYGGVQYLGSQTISATGIYKYTFTTVTGYDYAWVTISGAYVTSYDIWKVSEVSVVKMEKSASDFRIGAWNDTDGYPSVIGVHEQRLIFGSTEAYPLTAWFSRTGNFNNFGFDSPHGSSDAFTIKLDSGVLYPLKWIVSLNNLIIGTTGNEWRLQAGSSSTGMAVDSVDADPQSYNGSNDTGPLVIGNEVIYVQKGGDSVRSLTYSLEVDGYSGKDLTIMASHLFKDYGITEWTFAKSPYSIIWAIREDGTLLGFTYMISQDVWGWHRHVTEGDFESICSIPGSDGRDLVYAIVERTINSATKRFVEVLRPRISNSATHNYTFMDCSVVYDGVATTTITGLDHLEGEAVAVLADGEIITGKTVSSGQITLTDAAALVHVGLAFECELELLPIYMQDKNYGSSDGRKKTIPSVNIHFEDSRICKIGPDSTHLDNVRFRDDVTDDEPITLFTGQKSISLNSGYDLDGKLVIKQSDPVPLTILSVTPDVVVSPGKGNKAW